MLMKQLISHYVTECKVSLARKQLTSVPMQYVCLTDKHFDMYDKKTLEMNHDPLLLVNYRHPTAV